MPGRSEFTLAIYDSVRSLLLDTPRTHVQAGGVRRRGLDVEGDVSSTLELQDMPTQTRPIVSDRTSLDCLRPGRRCPSRAVSLRRALLLTCCCLLMMLGVIHILQGIMRRARLMQPFENLPPGTDTQQSLTSDIRNSHPVPCHSHNDYWRPRPLIDAISLGCSSVEADVWLVDGDLYVGHRLQDLDMNKSLRNMYLDPLLGMLGDQTKHSDSSSTPIVKPFIFHRYPNQTLTLLIDFKDTGFEAFQLFHQQLQPFRDKGYLTYHNGQDRINRALTVVATGQESLFQLILANATYRDVFFDAPLQRLWQPPQAPISDQDRRTFSMDYGTAMSDGLRPAIESPEPFDATNSYYASVSFRSAVGYIWRGHLSPKQMRVIRGQISGARRRGLKVRYWDTPNWPIALRNHVWHVLIKEGADVLSVDDIRGCAMESWRAKKHAWYSWW